MLKALTAFAPPRGESHAMNTNAAQLDNASAC